MYRHQRYIYDLTRKYYLLGRDRLLDRIEPAAGSSVLEVGCGTGRNLKILAERFPDAEFTGVDASAAMLSYARAALSNANISNVTLKAALAEELDLGQRFDAIFFSYSISMIPSWQTAIEKALSHLRPGGVLYVVDFYDQAGLPSWFRRLLTWWLDKFHVRYCKDLIPFLRTLEQHGSVELSVAPLYRRYSFIAEVRARP